MATLDGKWALVTGAARRVGASIARALHGAGAGVAIHYRGSAAAAEALVAELDGRRPGSAFAIQADLLDCAALKALVASTVARTGRLDALVNNASSFYPTPLASVTEAQWEDLIGTNLRAPLFLSQAALAPLRASGGVIMRDKASPADVQDTQTAVFDYDDLDIVWTQRNWGENPEPRHPWAATLYGDRGSLTLSVHAYEFRPHDGGEPVRADYADESDKYPEDAAHKETELFAAPATRRHMQDFLTARREGRKPVSDIEQGYISSACCILANLSMDLGRSLAWDGQAGRVRGDDEANSRLARAYRQPWQHPTPYSV
ncbi:MAG: hypothetical protein DCC67_09705 [Planctomycetota bacterium]|nr:MAG: hypothetical protein DCC67_09705 [Planctomycetota bacterium]